MISSVHSRVFLSYAKDPIDIIENLRYVTDIPFYNWRNGDDHDWTKYSDIMNLHDWCSETCNMRSEDKLRYLYKLLEEAIEGVFKKKSPELAHK